MANERNVLTVSDITKQIKQTLEESFSEVTVIGEISNFKAHVSGHWYFNLKDADAVISVTMWKGLNSYVFFSPRDGMKVIISGRITVYQPRGTYQLDARSMRPAGVGELQAAFEKLKHKLASEGLFDALHKKPVPIMSMKIGIVTASDGAAFRDMINIVTRRFPVAELVISPSRVQGAGAAESIVKSLNLLNQQTDIGVIILARGGGSIEDLWAFNEEIVARAIYKSRIPIVTGIGHETDFTIADFVADLRAPTPSAAMELVTPDKSDIFAFINEFSYNSTSNLENRLRDSRKSILGIISSYGFRKPEDMIIYRSQKTDHLLDKLNHGLEKRMIFLKNKLTVLTGNIESHDVRRSLQKGFALIKQDNKFITRAGKFKHGKNTELHFSDDVIELPGRNEDIS